MKEETLSAFQRILLVICFLGFLTASAYVKLLDTQNKYTELLPVTAVFDNPKSTEGIKGYYSDVIIHVDGR
jgi:hypothetical protein